MWWRWIFHPVVADVARVVVLYPLTAFVLYCIIVLACAECRPEESRVVAFVEEHVPLDEIFQVVPAKPYLNIDYFTVVLGVFEAQGDAKHFSKTLKKKHIRSRILWQQNRFHVVVGQYATQKMAEHTREQLQKRGYANGFIAGPGVLR